MNPKPFASLNHFTVPRATGILLAQRGAMAPRLITVSSRRPRPATRPASSVWGHPAVKARAAGLTLAASNARSHIHRQPKTPGESAQGGPKASHFFRRLGTGQTRGGDATIATWARAWGVEDGSRTPPARG